MPEFFLYCLDSSRYPSHRVMFALTHFTDARDNVNYFTKLKKTKIQIILECGPMPNVMAALPNIGDTLCSTPQSLADARY